MQSRLNVRRFPIFYYIFIYINKNTMNVYTIYLLKPLLQVHIKKQTLLNNKMTKKLILTRFKWK